MRQAITDFLQTNPYPGEQFYCIANEFFSECGTTNDQCDILDRWKKAKGFPIEPIYHYCELGEDGAVGKETLKENLEEGLRRAPTDLRLLAVAYDLACEEENWGRRLFYALELSRHGKIANDFVIYGIECGRNAMPERAEEAFQKALELDPKSVDALCGLAMCSFERVELGKAEELFRKVLKIDPENGCSKQELAKIDKIRKGEPWVKRAEARRKFWKHWADTELTRLTDEQRQKRMGEIVAKKR